MDSKASIELTSFCAVAELRWSRRAFMGSAVATAVAAALPGRLTLAATPSESAFSSWIEPSAKDELILAEGLKHDLLLRWGDSLRNSKEDLDPRTLQDLDWLDEGALDRAEHSFGFNNDAIAFFPVAPGVNDRGVLCVNHEYVNLEMAFAGFSARSRERLQQREALLEKDPALYRRMVRYTQAMHGVSVFGVTRTAAGWRVDRDGPFTRRITAYTPMEICGAARGDALMKTREDPTGTRALGTFANCAGGKTPWGTYLTAEENIQDYFGHAREWAESNAEPAIRSAHARWPLREVSLSGWDAVESRFDVRKEPNEALRCGWIVEIDPTDPASTPKKRTSLGRFCHEGANTILTKDGRVAAYMGDDAKFEYVYKFVTRGKFNPDDRRANLDLLDEGTLYVARYDADGRGEWLPLVHDENGPLNSRAGFRNQAEVVIKARAAADVLGATPMDRPEDVEPSPLTGRIYVACTKNNDRADGEIVKEFGGRKINVAPNSANPRVLNDFGHIVEMTEDDEDAASLRFSWNIFLLAGNPRDPDSRFLTRYDEVTTSTHARTTTYYAGYDKREALSPICCPDNLGFDPTGRLWIVTDSDRDLNANDGCYVVPTRGAQRGLLRQVVSAPTGAEVCGCEFTPDGTTLFLAIQHPGEGGTLAEPRSHWPDGGELPPRSGLIAVSRRDGKPL